MRYKMWDKQEPIYMMGPDENGKVMYTAEEYITTKAPWVNIPGVKVIISGLTINGVIFMEFEQAVAGYVAQGLVITDNMTDREILDAIEAFEDNPPVKPTPEERMAAALEFANLLNM